MPKWNTEFSFLGRKLVSLDEAERRLKAAEALAEEWHKAWKKEHDECSEKTEARIREIRGEMQNLREKAP